jgi:Co/Zn/Cd efflux system component
MVAPQVQDTIKSATTVSGNDHRLPSRLVGPPHVSRKQRLTVVLVLNLALVAGLVTVGVSAHSLAVLAEGSDYLLDAAGVGVALLAIRLSERPASRARPDGYPNATSFAALVNASGRLADSRPGPGIQRTDRAARAREERPGFVQ